MTVVFAAGGVAAKVLINSPKDWSAKRQVIDVGAGRPLMSGPAIVYARRMRHRQMNEDEIDALVANQAPRPGA